MVRLSSVSCTDDEGHPKLVSIWTSKSVLESRSIFLSEKHSKLSEPFVELYCQSIKDGDDDNN